MSLEAKEVSPMEYQPDIAALRTPGRVGQDEWSTWNTMHAPYVERLAASMLNGNRHDAAEVVQEAWYSVTEKILVSDDFEDTNPRGYLLTAVKSKALDRIRRNQKIRQIPASDMPDYKWDAHLSYTEDPEAVVVRSDGLKRFQARFDAAIPHDGIRETLWDSITTGDSDIQVGERKDVKERTVRTRIYRGKKQVLTSYDSVFPEAEFGPAPEYVVEARSGLEDTTSAKVSGDEADDEINYANLDIRAQGLTSLQAQLLNMQLGGKEIVDIASELGRKPKNVKETLLRAREHYYQT
jgi:DNA-directed RNA polymerase specialized sigma24 family protein